MAEIVIVGGGVVGLGLGMMLARDDHLGHHSRAGRRSRPPRIPRRPGTAGSARGSTSSACPTSSCPRYREILEAGAARCGRGHRARRRRALQSGAATPRIDHRRAPPRRRALRHALRAPGRWSSAPWPRWPRRRPGSRCAGAWPWRDCIGGPEAIAGIPHVTGVRTTDGEELRADLVIDCSGRRSALPDWLEALGAPAPGGRGRRQRLHLPGAALPFP